MTAALRPGATLVKLAVIIFLVEAVTMPFLPSLALSPTAEAIADAFLLTLLSAPFIFLVIAKLVDRAARMVQRDADVQARVVMDTVADAIITIDRSGVIMMANEATTALFGYERSALIGHNIKMLMPPPLCDEHDEYLRRYGDGEGIGVTGMRRRVPGLRGDGHVIAIEICINELPAGCEAAFVGVVRDMREREGAEERLRLVAEELETKNVELEGQKEELEAQFQEMQHLNENLEAARARAEAATRSKSEFLANMSHEIRTPMTAILGFADTLLDDELGDHERFSAIRTIQQNGKYLLSILNDILDLSKIEAGRLIIERTECSIGKLIAEVCSLIRVRAEGKGLAFEHEYVGAIPETIQTDPTRLRQILINLLGNAIKFTEVGGVRLVVRLGSPNPEPVLQFDVVDTGIGMDLEVANALFDPFTQMDGSITRRFGGTGLGLAISRRLACMLGGNVVVADTTAGVGTRFRATVATGPLDGVRMISNPGQMIESETWEGAGYGQRSIREALEGLRILLAEDGPDNQRLISYILRRAGADIEIVENGRQAVEAIENATPTDAAEQAFDCVLMDMQMPEMDGYEATHLLRQKGYQGPIIAITAHAMEGDRQKCLDAGCSDYATKPIDRKRLIGTIRQWTLECALDS